MDQMEKFLLGDQPNKCVGVGLRAQAQSIAHSEGGCFVGNLHRERKFLLNIF